MIDKLKIHKFLPAGRQGKILAGILGVLVFVGAIFGAYKLSQFQSQPQPTLPVIPPSPSSEVSRCITDSDCVLTLKIDECCSCPEVVSRVDLQKDKDLVEYKFGEDYSSRKTIDCSNVVCEPCVPPHGAPFCLEGQCRVGEKAFSEGKRVFCKDPRPEICTMEMIIPPPYICGSDGKSYGNRCWACANQKVDWYVIQETPCGI